MFAAGCSSPTKAPAASGTDVHVHIHNDSNDDMKFTGERYLLALEAANLKRAFVLSKSYSRFSNPTCWESKKCEYDQKWVRETNQWTIDQSKKFPQLIAFCGIDISTEADLSGEIGFCKTAGARGLKLHLQAVKETLTNPKTRSRFETISKTAGEQGLLILVHAGLQDPKEAEVLFEIAKAQPKTTFIFAHILGRNFATLARLAPSNVFVEVSAVLPLLRHKKAEVVASLRKFGIEKVLFGSDWPVYHPTEMLAVLKSYGFSEREMNMIISENAARLLP